MYPIGDEDLQLLEAYLDDALGDDEVQQLRDRLAVEPAMATALKMLREERAQRQAFFASIDPTPAEVDELVGSIKQQALRRRWFANPQKWLKPAAAMAACVLIGGLMGQLYSSHPGGGVTGPHVSDSQGDQKQYIVEVRDDAGNVVAVQHFKDAREARDFRNDLNKVQHQRRLQNGVKLVGDDF
jgi:anti-sigma factor RsiW